MDEKLTLDGSGTFHWREPCMLIEVTMTKEDVATLTGRIKGSRDQTLKNISQIP